MLSRKSELAQRVLTALTDGYEVPFVDAVQLRNWADCPEDSLLPLEEIARLILSTEENRTKAASEQD